MTDKKTQYEYNSIFPTAVQFSKIGRNWTKEECNHFDNVCSRMFPNTNNWRSENTYVLDDPSMVDIKKFILDALNNYVDEIVIPSNRENFEIYVTQSWLNLTQPGQQHDRHYHPNSFLTGVLYLKADIKYDTVSIFHPDYADWIHIESDKYNPFNTYCYTYPQQTGDLIIFPSNMHHAVAKTENPENRISLAFNAFIKGRIGSRFNLTELYIK